MAASGFAGLGYQIVWTQQSSLWLGHESAAVPAVVTAFFGGLAAGALTLGRRIEASARPRRWYVACELLIALWGLLLTVLMAPASGGLSALIGSQPTAAWQWLVAFGGSFFLLLPASAAMGATLPAMERLTAAWRAGGRSIAPLYASNTLGAVVGVLATAFWLVPELGLLRTAAVCAGLNLLCAGFAVLALPECVAAQAPLPPPAASNAQRAALTRLALTGLLGIGYEVLVVRVLSQVAEDTVYTFALLLAVYLVGSSLGAAAYQRWLAAWPDADRLRDRLLCALALACLVGSASLWPAEYVKAFVVDGLGASMAAALTAEAALALLAFGLPTLVMGALFCHLSLAASAAGVPFGRSLGVNTLGAAAAPVVFGVLLLPALGAKLCLLLIALGYLALTTRRAWPRAVAGVPLAVGVGVALWAPPLVFAGLGDGARLVSYNEGVMAAVSVVEGADGVMRLHINNRQQEGSNANQRVDGRQALLPLLLHPAPRRALFLGLGTGVTAGTAANDAGLQVDAVELLPEVIAASSYFSAAVDGAALAGRPWVMAADARRFVRSSDQRYDVIVADNFHPARSGSGALYSIEHFQAVRGRLAESGLFCQWLPLHQLDLATLRSIVQSFVAVYPGGWAVLANNSLETPVLGLVGRADGGRFDPGAVRQRLAGAALPLGLARYGIDDEFALLGSFVAGPTALARFAGDAVANTDDRPVVAYRAPRITYAPDSLPRDRLLALLAELAVEPAEVLADAGSHAELAQRLAAYGAARNLFILAGRDVRPSATVQGMLAQVREPLLAVLRRSPDFRPAYDPLLALASTLARSDVNGARELLRALVQVQPERPEAGQVLRQLDPVAR